MWIDIMVVFNLSDVYALGFSFCKVTGNCHISQKQKWPWVWLILFTSIIRSHVVAAEIKRQLILAHSYFQTLHLTNWTNLLNLSTRKNIFHFVDITKSRRNQLIDTNLKDWCNFVCYLVLIRVLRKCYINLKLCLCLERAQTLPVSDSFHWPPVIPYWLKIPKNIGTRVVDDDITFQMDDTDCRVCAYAL